MLGAPHPPEEVKVALWRRKANRPTRDGGDGDHSASPEEQFRSWLGDMDPKLAGFEAFGLPAEWSSPHRTRAALAELQDVLRSRYRDVSQLSDPGELAFVDGAVRYVGQTLIEHCGGWWDLQTLRDPVPRARPVLVLDVPDVSVEDPLDVLGMVRAVVRYRPENTLTHVFDLYVKPRDRTSADAADPTKEGRPRASGRLDRWLASMDEEVLAWRTGPAAPAARWDGSVASLHLLGGWVLDRFGDRDPEAFAPDSDDEVAFLGAARYLGETLLAHGAGAWAFSDGERRWGDPYAGRPYVRRGHPRTGDLLAECSVTAVLGGVVRRRDATRLDRSVDRYLRPD